MSHSVENPFEGKSSYHLSNLFDMIPGGGDHLLALERKLYQSSTLWGVSAEYEKYLGGPVELLGESREDPNPDDPILIQLTYRVTSDGQGADIWASLDDRHKTLRQEEVSEQERLALEELAAAQAAVERAQQNIARLRNR